MELVIVLLIVIILVLSLIIIREKRANTNKAHYHLSDSLKHREEHHQLSKGMFSACNILGLKPYYYRIDANQVYTDISSDQPAVSVEEFLSQRVLPNYQELISEMLNDLRSGVKDSFELKIETFGNNGNPEWSVVAGTAVAKDKAGRPHGIVGVLKNMSTEISEKTELENYNFKIAMICKSGKLGLWDYSFEDDVFCYPNTQNGVLTFSGVTWAKYLECVHPDDRHMPARALQRVMENQLDSFQACYRLKIPGQKGYRWFDIAAVVYKRDEHGNPLIVSGLRWDVTDNLTEKQKFEESQELLKLTFKAGGIIPWECDMNSYRLGSMSENASLFDNDYTVAEYAKMKVHPDHQQLFVESAQRLLRGEEDSVNLKIQTLYNGKYEWNAITGKCYEDIHTKSLKAIGVSQFITDDVEREQELIELRQKAEDSNRLKSTFLANMSHEIRTPLNAIVGFSELITQEGCTSEECEEYYKLIAENKELLLQLISDILDISKIEAGQMEFHFTDIDLCDVFDGLKATYDFKMTENVKLICELPETTHIINTERIRLNQVISNFLNNAIKFTPEGSITMGYTQEDGYLRIFVRDTGNGISSENVERVFERFVKLNHFVQGTGLGLSICHTIIQRLGGQIGVNSKEGEGSEFWFTIPDRMDGVTPDLDSQMVF